MQPAGVGIDKSTIFCKWWLRPKACGLKNLSNSSTMQRLGLGARAWDERSLQELVDALVRVVAVDAYVARAEPDLAGVGRQVLLTAGQVLWPGETRDVRQRCRVLAGGAP